MKINSDISKQARNRCDVSGVPSQEDMVPDPTVLKKYNSNFKNVNSGARPEKNVLPDDKMFMAGAYFNS